MMCAGVQKVSGPIDICQEMSQCPPIMLEAIPAMMHQIGHGTDSRCAEVCSLNRAWKGCPRGMVSAIAARSPDSSLMEIPCADLLHKARLHQTNSKYFFPSSSPDSPHGHRPTS